MNVAIIPAAIRKTLTVRATPDIAFRVFTADFGRWWPRAYSTGASPMTDAVGKVFFF